MEFEARNSGRAAPLQPRNSDDLPPSANQTLLHPRNNDVLPSSSVNRPAADCIRPSSVPTDREVSTEGTKTDAQVRDLAATLAAVSNKMPWRSCVSFVVEDQYLLAPDGTTIPLKDIDIEEPENFPNTRFRFLNPPKLTIPKRETLLLSNKYAQDFVLQLLGRLGAIECRDFAFGSKCHGSQSSILHLGTRSLPFSSTHCQTS